MADCEFLNTYNSFNLSKLPNKIQRAKDYLATLAKTKSPKATSEKDTRFEIYREGVHDFYKPLNAAKEAV